MSINARTLHKIIVEAGEGGMVISDGKTVVRIQAAHIATDNADCDHSDYHVYRVVGGPAGTKYFVGLSRLPEAHVYALLSLTWKY